MSNPRRRFLRRSATWAALALSLSACGGTRQAGGTAETPATPTSAGARPESAGDTATVTPAPPTPSSPRPAFESGVYRNLFAERGKSEREIAAKIDAAWQSLFASTDNARRIYYPAGENEHGPMA